MTQKSLFDEQAPRPSPCGAAPAIKANIDGGARGNPGPAAYGVIVRDAKGEIIADFSSMSNQRSPRRILRIAGRAVLLCVRTFVAFALSDLNFWCGRWPVQSEESGLIDSISSHALVRKLEHFAIDHVLRIQQGSRRTGQSGLTAGEGGALIVAPKRFGAPDKMKGQIISAGLWSLLG